MPRTFHAFSLIRSIFTNIFLKELPKEAHLCILTTQAIFTIILYVFFFIGFLKAKWLPKVTWEEEEEEKEEKEEENKS